MSLTQITWLRDHPSVKMTSTAEQPTCKSEMVGVEAADEGPIPTLPERSSSKRSERLINVVHMHFCRSLLLVILVAPLTLSFVQ